MRNEANQRLTSFCLAVGLTEARHLAKAALLV